SRSGKIDPDSALKKDLTGNSKAAFKGGQEKERYDNSLADEQLASLDQLIEIAGRDRFLDIKDIENLLGIAKKEGVTELDAMIYIEGYAKKKKWGIQKEQLTTTSKLLLCAFCNTLAESSLDKHCIKCGEALIQPCPHCGNATPTEYTACGQCGFHTGDAPLVKALFKDGEQYLFDDNYEQAIIYFDMALHYWEDWQPAISAKNKARIQHQALSKNIQQIKDLIKERKLEDAQAKLESLPKKLALTESESLTKIINKGLQDAKRAFDKADLLRRKGRSEEAFKGYEKSLSYCIDFSLALSAIAKTPPPLPLALNAEWVGDSLRLNWEQVNANGNITYYLIRKQKGLPMNYKDGELIAETSGVTVDDVTLTPGISFFYALFSSRAKVLSLNFVTSGPYFKLADISQLEYRVGHQQVFIEWQAPDNCHSVEVWRHENKQPERNKLGKKIVVSGNSLVDSNLKNDQRYGYLIVVKFKDPTGQTDFFYSKGSSFFATPTEPPKPILDLTVERRDRTAFLKWLPISSKNTHVQIRQTQLLPKATEGQLISTSKVNLFGSLVPISTDGQTQVTLDTQGCVFFTPLTVGKEMAVVGKVVRITTLDDVSNIRSQNTGRNISLSWIWPKGASEVLIAYQYDRFPLTEDEKESTLTKITRAEYDRKQCWELRSAAKKKHYFKVFVYDSIANINSKGVQYFIALGQERTVQYKVVTEKKLFAKKPHRAWVELSSDDSSSLYTLQVVMKVNYPPVSVQDGMLIIEVEQLNFREGKARIDIPVTHIKKGYIKIFFSDRQMAREIRLLPSAKEKLKII
ncbi:MAG: zinc ribbon domain-containing protein, partial [Endozoicomonadaceae bacterium]|nr:zinc ribbon domain-containing protein [Endozoicomonadaceae bacterium]